MTSDPLVMEVLARVNKLVYVVQHEPDRSVACPPVDETVWVAVRSHPGMSAWNIIDETQEV